MEAMLPPREPHMLEEVLLIYTVPEHTSGRTPCWLVRFGNGFGKVSKGPAQAV